MMVFTYTGMDNNIFFLLGGGKLPSPSPQSPVDETLYFVHHYSMNESNVLRSASV